MFKHLIEKPVLVRSHRGGVYLGTLLEAHENGAIRVRARRLWSWTGALDSSVLAKHGPTGGDMGPECDFLICRDAEIVEVVAATEESLAALAKIDEWKE